MIIKIIPNAKSTAANINTAKFASKVVANTAPSIKPIVAKKRATKIPIINPIHLQLLFLFSFWLLIQQ